MMNETHATRLVNVADALRDAHAEEWHFDMANYGYHQSYVAYTNRKQYDGLVEKGCGTPSCAIGHYAVRNDLQDKFMLTQWGSLHVITENTHRCRLGREIESHFGITHEEEAELFETSGCGNAETALEAAEYIEDFVERKGFDIVEDN